MRLPIAYKVNGVNARACSNLDDCLADLASSLMGQTIVHDSAVKYRTALFAPRGGRVSTSELRT